MNGETNDLVKADATQEVVVQKIPMLPAVKTPPEYS